MTRKLAGVAEDTSPPAEPRRDVLQDRLDDVGVVVDAELVRHGQQHGIGFRDGLVALELRNELIRFVGITAAENGALGCAEHADLTPSLPPRPKYMRSRSSVSAKMLRETDTRGVRACPASFHAAR